MRVVFTTRLIAVFISLFSACIATAQPVAGSVPAEKPYKIFTSGKQVTIRSTRHIENLMVWTTGGNRVVEQKNIHNNYCSFTIPVQQKAFYVMIALAGGKIYTEKIGLQ